jgi:hypothetical protein
MYAFIGTLLNGSVSPVPADLSILHGGGEVVGRVIGIQDFMRGYDYIIVRAPLWLR